MKKITAALLIVMVTGSLFLSCQSDLGDAVIGASGTSLGSVDTDGDGISDGTAIDSDGDGEADGIDTDGDGTIDEEWSSDYTITDSSDSSSSDSSSSESSEATVTEDGTEEHPFLIETADDLANVGAESTGYEDWTTSSYYKLTADIDLTASGYSEWSPISYISGSFDGNDHTISNMVITTSNSSLERYGLFRTLSWGAVVKDLTITGSITLPDTDGTTVNINKTDKYIGGLAGLAYGGSTPGGDSAVASTITNCHSNVSISTYGYMVGGLIGYCQYEGVEITGCSAEGSVTGGAAKGNKSEYGAVGGLIGYAEGAVINKSFATGEVSLQEYAKYAGGLVGITTDTSTYKNCYSQGDVSSVSGIAYIMGGFFGKAGGTLSATNCYASGTISGDYNDGGEGFYTEGSSVTASNCFAMDTNTASGVTTLTETQFKTKSTFTDAGWDFDSIWTIDDGNEYPDLQ
ncbi:MAG: GLUG motif-containing protein [Spirochaetales bacterium]|nr:GLUG motif-containing protein [Spirochaetales bacterium]